MWWASVHRACIYLAIARELRKWSLTSNFTVKPPYSILFGCMLYCSLYGKVSQTSGCNFCAGSAVRTCAVFSWWPTSSSYISLSTPSSIIYNKKRWMSTLEAWRRLYDLQVKAYMFMTAHYVLGLKKCACNLMLDLYHRARYRWIVCQPVKSAHENVSGLLVRSQNLLEDLRTCTQLRNIHWRLREQPNPANNERKG